YNIFLLYSAGSLHMNACYAPIDDQIILTLPFGMTLILFKAVAVITRIQCFAVYLHQKMIGN
ncbi:hypothetical protein ACJX0J_037430, partial [Zea mays]